MRKASEICQLVGGIVSIIIGSFAVCCLWPIPLLNGIFALVARKKQTTNWYITCIVFAVLTGGVTSLTGAVLGLVCNYMEEKPASNKSTKGSFNNLKELKELYDSGAITEEEYNELKQKELERF